MTNGNLETAIYWINYGKSLLTIKEAIHLFLPRRIAAYFDKKSTSRVNMFDEQF